MGFPSVLGKHCKILAQSITKNSTDKSGQDRCCCAIPSSPMGNSLGFLPGSFV